MRDILRGGIQKVWQAGLAAVTWADDFFEGSPIFRITIGLLFLYAFVLLLGAIGCCLGSLLRHGSIKMIRLMFQCCINVIVSPFLVTDAQTTTPAGPSLLIPLRADSVVCDSSSASASSTPISGNRVISPVLDEQDVSTPPVKMVKNPKPILQSDRLCQSHLLWLP